jgi:methylated-DNA-[protein]-cysteine S-methyltransferase
MFAVSHLAKGGLEMNYQEFESSVGRLHVVATTDALKVVAYDSNWRGIKKKIKVDAGPNRITKAVVKQITEYLSGRRTQFEIALAPEGTAFQKKVWNALEKIPFGETRTYTKLANKIGKPTAIRAVGRANGANPICILIPCHRVVGTEGHLTGYTAGIKVKENLLRLEQAKPRG